MAAAAEGPGDLLAGSLQLPKRFPGHVQHPSRSGRTNTQPRGAFLPGELSRTQRKPSLKHWREKPSSTLLGEKGPLARERLHQLHLLTCSPCSIRSSPGSPGMQGHQEEEEEEETADKSHGSLHLHHSAAAAAAIAAAAAGAVGAGV